MKYKAVMISEEVHQVLRMHVAQEGVSIRRFVEGVIRGAVSSRARSTVPEEEDEFVRDLRERKGVVKTPPKKVTGSPKAFRPIPKKESSR